MRRSGSAHRGADATTALRVDGEHVLALVGPPVPDRRAARPRRVRGGARRLDRIERARSRRLRGRRRSSAANDLRAAMLSAVSHDLRTPLASSRPRSVACCTRRRLSARRHARAFLAPSTRRPTGSTRLVGNLLDMSRLQTGRAARRMRRRSGSTRSSRRRSRARPRADAVDVDVAETLPRVVADPGLLERAIANIVANALGARRRRTACGSSGRRSTMGRPPRRRSRPRRIRRRARASVPAVPAARRQPATGGRRPRARGRARVRRGDGRRPSRSTTPRAAD